MAKQTVLQIVQEVLSSLDGDSVNSISDTVESLQVANLVQRKYYDIMARGGLPEQNILFQLNPSNDTTKPVLMTLPAGCAKVEWLKYFDQSTADSLQISQFGAYSHGVNSSITSTQNWVTTSTTSVTIPLTSALPTNKTFTVASSTLPVVVGQGVLITSGANSMYGKVVSYASTTLVVQVTSVIGSGTYANWVIGNSTSGAVAGYKYINILPIDQFVDMVNRFNPSDSNVRSYSFALSGTYDPFPAETFTLYYKNDIQPTYATIIENTYVLFDTFNNTFDDTLQASKTLTYGQIVTPFTLADATVPDLDDNQFPLLVNEVKSLAFYELKQTPHIKADQEIKRQWSVVQKNKATVNRPTYFEQLANFGRVPRTGGYSSGGYGAYKWMRQTGP